MNNYDCPKAPNTDGAVLVNDDDVKVLFDSATTQGDYCAGTDYKSKGELVGTAYVARDIVAIANALGEDGLLRYYGEYNRAPFAPAADQLEVSRMVPFSVLP